MKTYFTGFCVVPCLLAYAPTCASARPELSGGVTATYQATGDSAISNELTASADLVMSWKFGADELYTYIEANNSPKLNGVSSVLPEANADAGSALDKDREGRIQISEIGYKYSINTASMLIFGLIDVTAYFDQSRIASDENSQFLGVSFVQNPTIEFPDYTLGIVYETAFNQQTIMRAGFAASNGIADNPNLSYAQLVDINDDSKGVFSILSLTHKTPTWLFRGGAWANSADHDSLDATQNNLHNYGAYLLAGFRQDSQGINLRLGQSNDAISLAHQFVGLSYQYRQAPFVLGVGAARIFLSDKDPAVMHDDTLHYETYLRYRFNANLLVTADVQYLVNSNFNLSDIPRDHRQSVYGLRVTYIVE